MPPGDLDALDAAMTDDIGAVLLEPVMGEGGVRPLDDGYLRGVRTLCDERGALLVADEVQSGLGRCGDWAALQHAGVEADVLTLAKALGGGLPIGAMLARAEHLVRARRPRVDVRRRSGRVRRRARGPRHDRARRAARTGVGRSVRRLPAQVTAAAPAGAVLEARGRGCLWGFQLARPVANEVVLAMIGEGVLATPAGPDVVRMSPPLIAS